ncbi:protein kilB [Streptomyces sp. NPDC048057]|uniref:protein kilB n=1 Tax=Streptomyces sp. NPDC048057 TaxID=3155628 RepID=UPI0033EF09D1
MLAALIAVLGTLAGTIAASLLQQRSARADRVAVQEDTERRDLVAAVTALAVALADHRRAMWVREDLRLSDSDAADVAVARSESHVTRSALTAPLTALAILAPGLKAAAQAAAQATFDLRGATDKAALDALRLRAIEVADDLVAEAAAA